jgi:hypothetical protein
VFGLNLLANGEGALALKLIGSDGSNALADSVIRVGLKSTTLGNGNLVGLKGSSNSCILGARQDSGNGRNLASLLQSEGEPILLLRSQLRLGSESDGGVEEGRRGRDNDAILTKSIDGLLTELNCSSEISLPDVTTGNNAKRENNVGGLDGGEDLIELSGSTIKVDVETSNRELGNVVHVGVETGEVGGKKDLRGNLGKGGVCSGELGLESGSLVEDENGLINLNPFSTGGLEICEEGFIDRDKLGEQSDGLEARLGTLAGLSENEERDGSKDNGPGSNAGGLRLLEFFNGLVEVQFEVGLLRKLGNDEMVVRVEPISKWTNIFRNVAIDKINLRLTISSSRRQGHQHHRTGVLGPWRSRHQGGTIRGRRSA